MTTTYIELFKYINIISFIVYITLCFINIILTDKIFLIIVILMSSSIIIGEYFSLFSNLKYYLLVRNIYNIFYIYFIYKIYIKILF